MTEDTNSSKQRQSTQQVVRGLHRLERSILPSLSEHARSAEELAQTTHLALIEAQRAVLWLANKELATTTVSSEEFVSLGTNGISAQEKGLPERRALQALGTRQRMSAEELTKNTITSGEINIVIGALKAQEAVTISKDEQGLIISITEKGQSLLATGWGIEQFFQRSFPVRLQDLSAQEKKWYEQLKSRKDYVVLSTKKTLTAALTKKGREVQEALQSTKEEELVEQLTPALLASKGWKNKAFRPYDVSSNVPRVTRGRIHFVNEAIRYAKKLWLDMGFVEMTGNHVQTAFWDLDALFVPQDHPARQMQDTFYLEEPSKGTIREQELYERVKRVHQNGADTGSKGWRTPYESGKAMLNLLRTHTTVLSAQTLARTTKEGIPAKYFSVGKVYRNESLDWKHLFEFHQLEGIVIDPKANLRELKGYLEQFYRNMGFEKIRIRPAYFPYTEPSVEIEIYHEEKQQWIEMGGAGIFRPEVTKTLLGVEVPVLAWGLGLERIISPYYGITDIRELYSNDIEQLRTMKSFMK
jgi:phenylalanyl-tRNA synthetase alpha chain